MTRGERGPIGYRPTWPKDKLNEIKRLWIEGNSARVIAERFGATRNAIMGIVHRHGMHRPPSHAVGHLLAVPQLEDEPWLEVEPEPLPKTLPDRAELQAPRPRRPRTPEALPTSIGVTLLDLAPASCRWPIEGSGAATVFCGKIDPQPAPPYCAEHRKRGTTPGYAPRIRIPT